MIVGLYIASDAYEGMVMETEVLLGALGKVNRGSRIIKVFRNL